MSEPFLAEIRICSFNFAPRGWALCNGQLLPINQNQALFSLLGTTYGGDGRVNFALPDLRGRSARGFGTTLLGEAGGATSTRASTYSVVENLSLKRGLGVSPVMAQFVEESPAQSGQAISTMPPYLALNFMIALQGIFPSRN